MSSGTGSAGLLRAVVALALATAQPLSTRAARWTGRGTTEIEQASRREGPVTPEGGAFVIWAPLFALAACWGLGGRAVRALRHRQVPVAIAAGLGALAITTSSLLACPAPSPR